MFKIADFGIMDFRNSGPESLVDHRKRKKGSNQISSRHTC